jgi:hypothetical protein
LLTDSLRANDTVIFLDLTASMHAAVVAHLFPPESDLEQAAFGFAERVSVGDAIVFRMFDWMPVPPSGFELQLAYHFELTDEMKATVIKRAHDLGSCLVEFHCHTGQWPAEFSPSDRAGFREFVPHVLWRLNSRPYVAVVVARTGHDALAWLESIKHPQRVSALRITGKVLQCTARTPLRDSEDE